jgi:hypothetical protein
MILDPALINEAGAERVLASISDPVVRNLVTFGIAEARTRVLRRAGQDESQRRVELPDQPFDMQFYASTLASMFAKTDILKGVLNGQSLAAASGWDI